MADNIFSALVHRKNSGIIKEFVLWCTVCVAAVLSLIAAVLGKGNITWIMLMIFSIGLGVIMAFRLTSVALLYGSGAFYLILLVIHYMCFSKLPSSYYETYNTLGNVANGLANMFGGDTVDTPATVAIHSSRLNLVLFILLVLMSIALVACEFIHVFTPRNLKKVVIILNIADAAMIMLLQILIYAAGHLGEFSDWNKLLREHLNERGYWVGTISFWMILAVVVLLHIFFLCGMIEQRKKNITNIVKSEPKEIPASEVYGIRGIQGTYAGQVISLNNGIITIGSGSEVGVVISDGHVSRQHCVIRFNPATGFYEIYDNSSNGTYISTGARLQKGVYSAIKRGEIICIGSTAQQFQLL